MNWRTTGTPACRHLSLDSIVRDASGHRTVRRYRPIDPLPDARARRPDHRRRPGRPARRPRGRRERGDGGDHEKVHPVRSHSNAAAGGINAALNPEDSWESHAFDTVKGSDYLGDQDAIEIMCREAPDEILWLEHRGVTFHRDETGHLGTRAFGGASAARTYYVADITGQALLHVLYEQLMKHHEPIDRYEEWFVTSLVQDDEAAAPAPSCATSATAKPTSSRPRR